MNVGERSDPPRETALKLVSIARTFTTLCGLAYYSLDIYYSCVHYPGRRRTMNIVAVSGIVGTGEAAASRTSTMTFGDRDREFHTV